MINNKYTWLVAACGIAAGCAQGPVEETQQVAVGQQALPANVVAGYTHSVERSAFNPGQDAVVERNRGKSNTVGKAGVFSVSESNGAVRAIPNAEAASRKKDPFGASEEEHNAKALEYFTGAGLPMDQVEHVQGHELVGGAAKEADTADAKPKVIARYSALQRSVEGVPVHDSVAWVRFNEDGESVSETVYWPELKRGVVERAKKMADRLQADPEGFRTHLPEAARVPAGEVVIRHSSLDDAGQFEARAVYQVETRTGNRAETRLFDQSGAEVKLARQQRTPRQGMARPN